ncbi:unnamed protein product [Pleuronectes platessa]|uniref:Uncharacterized protein n=1 Tax=Pleuronectes platessa TaxID=8262 RepID=A0A9N7UYC5_PLEPL|nr:unnamed protein product [Pleuronectes platessa]
MSPESAPSSSQSTPGFHQLSLNAPCQPPPSLCMGKCGVVLTSDFTLGVTIRLTSPSPNTCDQRPLTSSLSERRGGPERIIWLSGRCIVWGVDTAGTHRIPAKRQTQCC